MFLRDSKSLSPEGRNLILVLGPTGGGKSTFVNYMAKCPMEIKCNKIGENVIEIKHGFKEICKTSDSIESTTFCPQVVLIDKNIELLDCPAHDYDGSDWAKKDIAILSTQHAIHQAASINGIVILINHNDFSSFYTFYE